MSKEKWRKCMGKIEKYMKSAIGVSVILIGICCFVTILNVKYLSNDISFQNTLYNIVSSLVIGVISSAIVTIIVEVNHMRDEKQKRLSVLHELNFEISHFCSLYARYADKNERHPNGHPLLFPNEHLCDKYVFLHSVVEECRKTYATSKYYLNPKEISLLSMIVTNYHCMEKTIGVDLLSLFEFDRTQHQLESQEYDELLDEWAKKIIPELFEDIISEISRLKTELELEGFEDIFQEKNRIILSTIMDNVQGTQISS